MLLSVFFANCFQYFNPSDSPLFLFDLYFIALTVFIFINHGLIILLVFFHFQSGIHTSYKWKCDSLINALIFKFG